MLKYAEKGRGDLEPYFSYHGNLISAHYAANDAPDPDRFRMHTHDACELFCFLEGKGSFQIEGSSYPLTPGDILLMRPLEAHYIRIDPACRYTRFAIHFRPSLLADIDPDGRLLRPFTGREAGRRNLYHAEDFDSPLSRLLLQNAVAPCEDRRLQLITCLVPLLGEIERVFRAQSDAPADETQVFRILHYINNHIAEPITLDTICRTFYISKPQLCRSFKRATGSTVWDYITVKRLMNARQHILSGASPTKVFAMCGFSDYSAFYRAYRKAFGISPAETLKVPGDKI